VSENDSKIIGSLTVDVEEYFQVEAYAKNISINDWKNFESRIVYQIELLLDLFSEKGIKATFFILGIVAEKHPQLIKKISAMGHEIASHGYYHQHLTKLNSKLFFQDINDAKKLLEDLTSAEIIGYRAPCFSITPSNEWAFDNIRAAGYQYSSSTYPIEHDFYGVPLAPRTPYFLDNGLLEVPVSTLKFAGKTKAAGGGGFFRLYPFWLYNMLLKKSSKQLEFFNFYTHPWEYDPQQPKLTGSLKSNFRHRVNQKTALTKLSKLCDNFSFDTVKNLHLTKEYKSLGNWADISRGKY
jgi:polysaccharide deacetylase family protein (PEP-CTERM system associated)